MGIETETLVSDYAGEMMAVSDEGLDALLADGLIYATDEGRYQLYSDASWDEVHDTLSQSGILRE